jgi:hypothetical protein
VTRPHVALQQSQRRPLSSALEANLNPRDAFPRQQALQQSKQNVPEELLEISEAFKKKVEAGDAKWAGSGFHGKGYGRHTHQALAWD